MGFLIKILASILSIVTAGWAFAESARRGLLIVSSIFAALKIIAFIVFLSLVALVIYLLLKDRNQTTSESAS